MWFYGAGFSVNSDPVYLPVSVILWVRRKVDLKHFVTIPIMYLVGIFPAWLAGRPFMELMESMRSREAKTVGLYLSNSRIFYQIIGNNFFLDEYVNAGMLHDPGNTLCWSCAIWPIKRFG